MSKKLTYLACPLNWGLGHASRMIPVVYDLLNNGHKVILGGDGDALKLISQEFPELKQVIIPDLKVSFKYRWMTINLLGLIPKIIFSAYRENKQLKSLVKLNPVDVIISDNRYGLWNKNIKSIFVTHQTMVKLPWLFKLFEYPIHLIINKAISQFNECWIPDYKNIQDSLSGDLSHKYKLTSNTKFIGPLSRYSCIEKTTSSKTYDIVAILSGPEPQRSQLELKLKQLLKKSKHSAILIQGKPSINRELISNETIDIVPHLSSEIIKSLMIQSKLVICRSGYTSIMDLYHLNCKALLIPTEGQTEQVYLAKHLNVKYLSITQKKLNSATLDSFDL